MNYNKFWAPPSEMVKTWGLTKHKANAVQFIYSSQTTDGQNSITYLRQAIEVLTMEERIMEVQRGIPPSMVICPDCRVLKYQPACCYSIHMEAVRQSEMEQGTLYK